MAPGTRVLADLVLLPAAGPLVGSTLSSVPRAAREMTDEGVAEDGAKVVKMADEVTTGEDGTTTSEMGDGGTATGGQPGFGLVALLAGAGVALYRRHG